MNGILEPTLPPRTVYCGLCREPKAHTFGFYFCQHCDATKHCKGDRCGACELSRKKEYPPS